MIVVISQIDDDVILLQEYYSKFDMYSHIKTGIEARSLSDPISYLLKDYKNMPVDVFQESGITAYYRDVNSYIYKYDLIQQKTLYELEGESLSICQLIYNDRFGKYSCFYTEIMDECSDLLNTLSKIIDTSGVIDIPLINGKRLIGHRSECVSHPFDFFNCMHKNDGIGDWKYHGYSDVHKVNSLFPVDLPVDRDIVLSVFMTELSVSIIKTQNIINAISRHTILCDEDIELIMLRDMYKYLLNVNKDDIADKMKGYIVNKNKIFYYKAKGKVVGIFQSGGKEYTYRQFTERKSYHVYSQYKTDIVEVFQHKTINEKLEMMLFSPETSINCIQDFLKNEIDAIQIKLNLENINL